MAKSIIDYLRELKERLEGLLPRDQIESLVQETGDHLSELREELGTEELAIAKFGAVESLAESILKDRNKVNTWKASAWPIGVLVGGTVLAILISRVLGPIRTPFSSMDAGIYVIWALPFAFAFACYRAKQLFPLQLALLALVVCLFRIGVDAPKVAVDTQVYFGERHPGAGRSLSSGVVRARAGFSVLFPDIRYVFVPDRDLKSVEAVARETLAKYEEARSGLDSEAAVISAAEAHASPNDELREYPLPGKYVGYAKQYGGEGDPDPDFQKQKVLGLKNAASFWKPSILAKARQAIGAESQDTQSTLAAMTAEEKETSMRRLGLATWTHALHFFDEFLYFFLINLAAYGLALFVEKLKRQRRKGMQTAD